MNNQYFPNPFKSSLHGEDLDGVSNNGRDYLLIRQKTGFRKNNLYNKSLGFIDE